MLFPGLECQPVGETPAGILCRSNQPSRQRSHHRFPGCDESGVRPAVSKWHAESLGRPNRDIGSPLAWRHQKRKGQEVGCDRDHAFALVNLVDEFRVVVDPARRTRVLEKDPKGLLGFNAL